MYHSGASGHKIVYYYQLQFLIYHADGILVKAMKQLRFVSLSAIRKTFSYLFLVLVVILMLLPFVTTFNELLTRIVENSLLYKPIQKYVVPYEVMLVRTIVSWFGIVTIPGTVSYIKNGANSGAFISWNCIGWQSFIILLLSLKTGLEGRFSFFSRIEVLAVGLIGTFMINIFRISLIIILLYYFGRVPAAIVHDYAAVFISLVWLFGFWWFSYRFVLEEK